MSGIAVSVVALIAWASTVTLGQATAPPGKTLAARLPATIDGAPVQIVAVEDLQTQIDAWFPGQSHPEIEALKTELAARGLSLADVTAVSADFTGEGGGGSIQGYGIQGEDTASLEDAITSTYLIGVGELERTEGQVGDHVVTYLSEGPLEGADYPFAVMPDTGVLWIVVAETGRILDTALEALLAVSAGEAPGNTGTAPTPQPAIGPATWSGTMRQTVTWNRGVYIGEATTTFRGTLERVEEGGSGWCGSNCAAYLPHGEVTWTWESAGPNCRNRQSGSVSTGDVVTPADQMLIMEADGPDHLRYWGRGQVMAGQQDCNNPEGGGDVGSFLEIPPYEGNPYADEVPTLRPRCAAVSWRIEVDATELKGSCWGYDEQALQVRYEWDLRDVDTE